MLADSMIGFLMEPRMKCDEIGFDNKFAINLFKIGLEFERQDKMSRNFIPKVNNICWIFCLFSVTFKGTAGIEKFSFGSFFKYHMVL
jgi:hypothetical protein